jgi:hypothetical protein
METYHDKVFNAKDTRVRTEVSQPDYHCKDNTVPKSLEEIAPFTIDKRDAIFKSNQGRDPLGASKDELAGPGPTLYDPKL